MNKHLSLFSLSQTVAIVIALLSNYRSFAEDSSYFRSVPYLTMHNGLTNILITNKEEITSIASVLDPTFLDMKNKTERSDLFVPCIAVCYPAITNRVSEWNLYTIFTHSNGMISCNLTMSSLVVTQNQAYCNRVWDLWQQKQ